MINTLQGNTLPASAMAEPVRITQDERIARIEASIAAAGYVSERTPCNRPGVIRVEVWTPGKLTPLGFIGVNSDGSIGAKMPNGSWFHAALCAFAQA